MAPGKAGRDAGVAHVCDPGADDTPPCRSAAGKHTVQHGAELYLPGSAGVLVGSWALVSVIRQLRPNVSEAPEVTVPGDCTEHSPSARKITWKGPQHLGKALQACLHKSHYFSESRVCPVHVLNHQALTKHVGNPVFSGV